MPFLTYLTEDFIRVVKIIALAIIKTLNFMGPSKTLPDFGHKPYDDNLKIRQKSESEGSVVVFPVPLRFKLAAVCHVKIDLTT